MKKNPQKIIKFSDTGYYHFTIPVPPRTKKNHGQIIKVPVTLKNGKKSYRYSYISSKQYLAYSEAARYFIPTLKIDEPVNVKALYYMPTRRTVDLINLHEALHDIMVENNCIKNDDSRIIVSTDGSRVLYDKENPRTEVYIERIQDYQNPFEQ